MRGVTICSAALLVLFIALVPGSLASDDECEEAKSCSDGVIIPAWTPVENISTGTKVLRAIVYFLALCYMFLGVSKIADIFMESIEVITSTTQTRKFVNPDGTEELVDVQVWNETVANLTLMALGSSAPEILLSVIEIVGNDFESGDLGPGTIVGSAAFNLFIITAICVMVIPDGEMKMIKNFGVFLCTATWSVFAYVWLYMMIAVITPGVVDWWEGLITLLLFVVLIVMSYTIDKNNESCSVGFRIIGIKSDYDDSTVVVKNGSVAPEKDDKEKIPLTDVENGLAVDNKRPGSQQGGGPINFTGLSTKERIVEILKSEMAKSSDPDEWQRNLKANLNNILFQGRSKAFFRIHSKDVKREKAKYEKFIEETISRLQEVKSHSLEKNVVFCANAKVKFPENCGEAEIVLEREGPFIGVTATRVNYKATENKKAKYQASAGKDFEATEGTLVFEKNETKKVIKVKIHDDPDFEEDEEFIIQLTNLQEDAPGTTGTYKEPKLLSDTIVCVIIDDDHHGKFGFSELTQTAMISSNAEGKNDSCVTNIKVERAKGCKGQVTLPFEIQEGSAIMGKHFTVRGENKIVFSDRNCDGSIPIETIPLFEDTSKDLYFDIMLKDPEIRAGDESDDPRAKPGLVEGMITCRVKLTPGIQLDQVQDLKEAAESDWGQRIKDSLFLPTDPKPSVLDYVMHYLQMPFTLLFCLVPPPGIWGGWATFAVAITFVGAITALIGDLAGAFGCTVGLKDTVTAITLVALGTSLPDTFASKLAAVNDKYADSSVGNVTGSNAVNVFLGVGVAWFVAAVYHNSKGEDFIVEEGSLGLSVSTFVLLAILTIVVLIIRRLMFGTELGGSKVPKYCTAGLFVSFWFIYLLVSILNAYCVIPNPF